MEQELELIVKYKDNEYKFEYGSEVFIFQTAIYNDINDVEEILEIVRFAQECYLKDSNNTNLGNLADYIALNWESVKDLSVYEVLDKFYDEQEY